MRIKLEQNTMGSNIVAFPRGHTAFAQSCWSAAARSDHGFMDWLEHCEADLEARIVPTSESPDWRSEASGLRPDGLNVGCH